MNTTKASLQAFFIYATLFVVIFSLSLAVFLYTSRDKTAKLNATEQDQTLPTPLPSSKSTPKPGALKLTIASPQDNAVINNNTIKLAGAAKTGSLLSITGGKEDVVEEVAGDGTFIIDLKLNEGENSLVVTAFDQSGIKDTVNLSVISLLE